MKHLVNNKTTGQFIPIKNEAYESWSAYFDARQIFEDFAKNKHNNHSIYSAKVYMGLMSVMDLAKKHFRPYENAWCIAHEGYSLN